MSQSHNDDFGLNNNRKRKPETQESSDNNGESLYLECPSTPGGSNDDLFQFSHKQKNKDAKENEAKDRAVASYVQAISSEMTHRSEYPQIIYQPWASSAGEANKKSAASSAKVSAFKSFQQKMFDSVMKDETIKDVFSTLRTTKDKGTFTSSWEANEDEICAIFKNMNSIDQNHISSATEFIYIFKHALELGIDIHIVAKMLEYNPESETKRQKRYPQGLYFQYLVNSNFDIPDYPYAPLIRALKNYNDIRKVHSYLEIKLENKKLSERAKENIKATIKFITENTVNPEAKGSDLFFLKNDNTNTNRNTIK